MAPIPGTTPVLFAFRADLSDDSTSINITWTWQSEVPGGYAYVFTEQEYALDDNPTPMSITSKADVVAAYLADGYAVSF